ncbi:MAG TPA: hypothetical protein VND64_03380 [Pirellulales bacterium]|nr:hypothetical protein [Pirellulales bacterium]
MTKSKRKGANDDLLLEELKGLCSQGQAENEPEDQAAFLRNFLPIRSHYRILDPDTQLIIGDKGAGKTQVFRALGYEQGREELTRLAKQHSRLAVDLERTAWLIGFAASSTEFPPGGAIRVFAQGRGSAELQSFWLALLTRVLLNQTNPQLTIADGPLVSLLRSPWSDLEKVFAPAYAKQGLLFAAIDELDRKLQSSDGYVFVTYDELDRVSPGDWTALETILQGLVQFWAAYGRRWKRVRPKLFLRRDLYERAALFGPDIAKIAAHRAELLWDIGEFYGVLIKRILNSRGVLPGFLGNSVSRTIAAGALGTVPLASSEEEFAPALERLFGKYMGPDARKGFASRWVPNHLKDGHRRIYPRPLLRLVEEAAVIEQRDTRAKNLAQLIHHTALRGALDRVSEFRVQELIKEEFPWLERVRSALELHPFVVPVERKLALKSLAIRWPDGADRPPSTEPNDVLDYLVELGIAQNRRDGRVDVGDLYLRGLHLKRKGGVARPKGLGRPV